MILLYNNRLRHIATWNQPTLWFRNMWNSHCYFDGESLILEYGFLLPKTKSVLCLKKDILGQAAKNTHFLKKVSPKPKCIWLTMPFRNLRQTMVNLKMEINLATTISKEFWSKNNPKVTLTTCSRLLSHWWRIRSK